MAFPDSPGPPPTILNTNWGVGAWIWSDRTGDKQSCCLWRAFDIPPGALVVKARLRMTADNGFNAMLDGHELGRGSDWRWLTEFDLDNRLRPGRHVLTVEAFNDALAAGVLAGLRIELEDGQIIEVASDQSWRIVPEGEKHWQNTKNAPETWTPATVVGAFSSGPWNITPRGVVLVTPPTVVALRFWQTGWFQIGLLALLGMGAVVCLRLLAELTFQSRSRALLQRERARIARDIHDDLGAGLTQLVLLGELVQHDLASSFALVKHASNRSANLEPARHDPAAHPARHEEIDKLCDKTRALLGSMDEIVWAVNSRRDTIREFAAYSCKYAQSFLANTSIRCRLDVEPNLPDDPFDLPTRRNLFLAVKEALNNAARHSGASQIFLRIHRLDGNLAVTVEDDGTGFNVESATGERNGLGNIVQRMNEVGGKCVVASMPGAGCRIDFRVPLSSKQHSRFRWFRWRSAAILPQTSAQPIRVEYVPTPPLT